MAVTVSCHAAQTSIKTQGSTRTTWATGLYCPPTLRNHFSSLALLHAHNGDPGFTSRIRFRETPRELGIERRHAIPKAHQAVSFLGHQDGHLPVGGEFDLSPSHRIHLHYLIGQGVEVEEGTDFAAEGTCLVLVQGQLQAVGQGQLGERKNGACNTWSPRTLAPPPLSPSKLFFRESS